MTFWQEALLIGLCAAAFAGFCIGLLTGFAIGIGIDGDWEDQ